MGGPKRKGLWVGGMVPLGYELKDGKLLTVEEEAERVRMIFARYLALGSVNRLVLELRELNIRTKIRRLSNGNTRGGVPFTQGPLFYILRNRSYIGEVVYKGEVCPGPQPPRVDRLDEIISDSTTVEDIAARQKCSVRHVNLTISLAFIAPGLVKAGVEGRLPRGIGVAALRDPPAEWSLQFARLGLTSSWFLPHSVPSPPNLSQTR